MEFIKKCTTILVLFFILTTLFSCQNKEYTITFETNGGSEVTSITKKANSAISKPKNPIKEGYTFNGWYLDKELTKKYTFSKMPDKNITLYAKWIISKYTVTFYSNGGNDISPITIEHNKTITKPNDPINPGYTFLGWFKDLDSSELFDFSTPITKNITLYAKWHKGNIDKELLRKPVYERIQDAVDKRYNNYSFNLLQPKGDVNILVIPIEFPDDRFTIDELMTIEKLFFGESEDVETLKTFYEKSSYGNLNIDGEVLEPFTASRNSSYYEYWQSPFNEFANGVDLLIEEAITYYLSKYPTLDLSPYDFEDDCFLDAVFLVYSADINYVNENSIYWAYQYFYYATKGVNDDDYLSWGGYELNAYVFTGVDFFYEKNSLTANTIIHETGHLLGLEDYYDYSTDQDSNSGGLGGADMMDSNIGDHNAFSKLLLDWIDPIVVDKSLTVTIDAFVSSGDAIIVSHNFTSIFSEYFILSYYTPNSLNSDNPYLTESGLIMYHVNAVLPEDYDNLAEYSYYFKYNNSDSYYKLIKIEEADGFNDISNYGSNASNNDLLKEGKSYILRMYDNRFLCTVTVKEMTPSSITLSFDFK